MNRKPDVFQPLNFLRQSFEQYRWLGSVVSKVRPQEQATERTERVRRAAIPSGDTAAAAHAVEQYFRCVGRVRGVEQWAQSLP
jgi:hypothetical protein